MFTKRKFLHFSKEQQHKKCAELLQNYSHDPHQKLVKSYNQLQAWLHLSSLAFEPQAIADRFHWHLHQAKQHLKEHNLLPKINTGDKQQGKNPWPIAIYLDNIRSAHNVGSIIRTCEAFALGTLYFSAQTPKVDHPQVQKTAMGAAQMVCAKTCNDINTLQKPLIALETSAEAMNLQHFLFPESFTVAVGNEEYGLSQSTLNQVDHLLTIPLRGRKNSLNVANAFAIVAAEILRQKGMKNDN